MEHYAGAIMGNYGKVVKQTNAGCQGRRQGGQPELFWGANTPGGGIGALRGKIFFL